MVRFRGLLALVVLCFALSASPLRAQQDAEALAQEEDDRATTLEARKRALTTLLVDARHSRDTGELLKAARFMNRAGRLQLRLNLLQDALATYQDALAIIKQAPDSSTNIDSLVGLGHAYNHLSKCVEAQAYLRQAITLSEQNNDPAGKADALLAVSHCQNYGDHALALRTAQEALVLWQNLGRKRGMAESYAAIGQYQLTQNKLTEATQSYEAALNFWRELNVSDEQAETLINLGFIEYRKGAWENVLTFLTQAHVQLDEKAEPYKMGKINAGLAAAFIESGMPEYGLTKYLQALEYYRQTQNPRAVIVMFLGIGRAYYLLGNYQEALVNLQRALTDAESIKESTIVALIKESLGSTYFAMDDQTTALRHFQAAVDLYTQVASPMEAARTRALMGQVYQQQGKVEQAWDSYQKALETFRALSDHINESATLYAIGRLKMEQNNPNEAEEYLKKSIAVTEDIRRVSTSSDLTVAFSASIHERYETYIECLMRKRQTEFGPGLSVLAFEMSELARARSLAELLRTTQTNLVTGLNSELAKQEKFLRQSLKVKEDSRVNLLARKYAKEELQALDAELARLETEYKQVTEIIRAQYPSYQQVTRPDAWDLRQIQEQVVADDQTVLLEYSLGADRSYVWAVTRNDIKSYELPSQARINEAAQKVYRLLTTTDATKSGDELNQATRELGQMVLSPVASELNKSRMIVVADGALHYIPFQILPASSAGDQPLVATTEVINAPSASILGQLREETARRQTPTKVLAAFGDPVFESNYAERKETGSHEYVASVQPPEGERWRHALRDIEPTGDSLSPAAIQPLFFAKRELANLRDVAGSDTLIITGFDATRERLSSADLTKYAILHFATHGVLDPKRPENSGLFLSMVNRDGQEQNGFVGLQDIYGLHAPVDLVVLSACRTGLGKDVRGEGLIGLTRGFMYAGASSVVASLWKVDDEATAELMKRFYIHMLQGGMTPAAALRAAQNSIRQQPQWRSPYYWAAFTLQGEFKQVIKPAPVRWMPGRWQIVLGLSLLLFLAAAEWYRRSRVAKA